MKKIFITTAAIISPFVLNAQDFYSPGMNHDIFNICAVIFMAGLIMLFLLTILKRIVDFRLKSKIVDKGIPENIVSSILQSNPKEDRNINIKWFAILAGLGVALTIIKFTMPLGIHSVAIMAFCIAGSFLGYFFFIKYSEK
jgi:hypothetical protein